MIIKILGLDPSLRNWGIAKTIYDTQTNILSVVDTSIIHTKPIKSKIKQSTKDLLASNKLYTGITPYYKDIDLVIAEVPSGSQSSRAMVSYGVCIGVLGSLQALKPQLIQVAANDVKTVVGANTTSKKEIINWVKHKHPEASLPKTNKAEHICDAIVAIYAGLKTKTFKEFINENST